MIEQQHPGRVLPILNFVKYDYVNSLLERFSVVTVDSVRPERDRRRGRRVDALRAGSLSLPVNSERVTSEVVTDCDFYPLAPVGFWQFRQ